MKFGREAALLPISLILTLCFVFPTFGIAGTIISIGGSNDVSYVLGSNASAVDVESWSSTNTYTGVSITFTTDNRFMPPTLGISGTAYLMSQIGPGTTLANQLATASFTTNLGGLYSVPLFSSLTLGPGNYFLVLTGSSISRPWITWDASAPTSNSFSAPVFTTGPGITWQGDYFATTMVGSLNTSYLPASTFQYLGTGQAALNLHFDVEGTAVPEPSASALFLLGFSAIGIYLCRVGIYFTQVAPTGCGRCPRQQRHI